MKKNMKPVKTSRTHTTESLLPKQLVKNEQYYTHVEQTVHNVGEEINAGLKLLNSIDKKIITFFGGHALDKDNKYYTHCENVAYELGKRGYAIITGGGPGIMQAANSGAMRAKSISIGFKAKLLMKEQGVKASIFTEKLSFRFLFTRRFALAIKSDALIFYPGGYGTLNELFEYVTLIQTGMADPVPIICVNKKYWKGLFQWLKQETFKEGFIGKQHLSMIHFADDIKEILNVLNQKN
jgi:uncharacterized protein (TIGR00730 family)